MALTSRLRPWHMLVIVYALLVLTLTGAVGWLGRPGKPPAALSEAVLSDAQGRLHLTISGEGLHEGLNGVYVETLFDAVGKKWQFLDSVAVRTHDLSEREDLALVACLSTKLVSIGLHPEQKPIVLGSLDMPATVDQIEIVGSRALVRMMGYDGLASVDLSDPGALRFDKIPAETGREFVDMALDGQVAFLVDRERGLYAADFSLKDPELKLVSAMKSAWRVASEGGRLVVGGYENTLRLYEHNGTGPLREQGVIALPAKIIDLQLTGEMLVVSLTDRTLQVYRLSGWPSLPPPAVIDLPNMPINTRQIPGRDSIVVSMVGAGLGLVDISGSAPPVLAGYLKLPKTFQKIIVRSETVYASGHYGFEAYPLALLSTARPPEGAVVSTTEQKFFPWGGKVYGHRNSSLTLLAEGGSTAEGASEPFLAVAGRGEVELFARPGEGQSDASLVSRYEKTGVKAALWHAGRLFLVHDEGLDVLVGKDPGTLVQTGSLTINGVPDRLAMLSHELLLVTTRHEGSLVVDVTDPRQPKAYAQLPILQHGRVIKAYHAILVDGRRVYVSEGEAGVQVFDLRDTSRPLLRQFIDTPGMASGLALHEGLLLVADGPQGVFIVDVKDEDAALPVGSLPTPLTVRSIAVADDGMLVSSHPGGTMKLPLPRRLEDLRVVNEREAEATVDRWVPSAQVYLYDDRSSARVGISNGAR